MIFFIAASEYPFSLSVRLLVLLLLNRFGAVFQKIFWEEHFKLSITIAQFSYYEDLLIDIRIQNKDDWYCRFLGFSVNCD
jgi:hypothetical protein